MPKPITISNFALITAVFRSEQFSDQTAKQVLDSLNQRHGCLLIDTPTAGYWEMWRLLREIPTAYHKHLIIAQHHELRREFGIRGIHFSAQQPFAPGDYGGKVLGITVNGFEEALRWGNVMNYIILELSSAYHMEEIVRFEQAFRGKAYLIPASSLRQMS